MDWKPYIKKVLHQVHSDEGISSLALNTVNSMVCFCCDNLCRTTQLLMKNANKNTIGVLDIETAVKIYLPGEIARHAVSEGKKAVQKYKTNIKNKELTSRSAKAKLEFSVSRTEKHIRSNIQCKKMNQDTPVFLAAVLEYLVAEILELAGNLATDSNRVRIIPRDIMMVISNDEEHNHIFKHVTIPYAGIQPNIHSNLLPKQEGGVKKHKKLINDNIQGITKPAIKRLAHRGGVKFIASLVYEEIRGILKIFLESVIRQFTTITEHVHLNTITKKNVLMALGLHYKPLMMGGDSTEDNTQTGGKYKPGTVALRNIIRYQNTTELLIPKAPFQRLVREIANDFKLNLRFSADAFAALQHSTEAYLIDLFQAAILCTVVAQRQILSHKDLSLVRKIRNEDYDSIYL